MKRAVSIITLVGLAICPVVSARPAFAQNSGEWTDGSRITGVHLEEWDEPNHQPKLFFPPPPDKPAPFVALFEPTNPIRWLRNDFPGPITMPSAFVELIGGDCIPGRVVGYQSGSESPLGQRPPHLLVLPGFPVTAGLQTKPVRVIVADIRRVVFQRRLHEGYTPNTLYYVDGRQKGFRQMRWGSDGVTLLLEDGGTISIRFEEIAELHMPQRDSWQSYCLMLARIAPDCKSRLMRVETTAGLIATTSMERFRVAGGLHMVQPAWSLDPIWVRWRSVFMRRFFAPHELPLSWLAPVRVAQKSPLGGVRPWQVDRSTTLGPLRSGGLPWSWGLGVHAHNELEFELPAMVRSFRTHVGLDEEVRGGGCAKALVYANAAAGAPLWQSPLLIGSKQVVDSGAVALSGPAGGQKSIVLVADMAHQDRPAGTDPLNIRDMVDWLEPTIELDPQQLAAEVAKLTPQTIAAWQDWNVTVSPGGKLVVSQRWEDDHYEIDVRIFGGRLLLSRKLDISPEQPYLAVGAVQVGSASLIDVRVNGAPVAWFLVPARGVRLDPQPLVVPLEKWAGRSATLEIEQFPSDDNAMVSWRGIVFMANPEFGVPLKITAVRAASPETTVSVERGDVVLAINKTPAKTPDFDAYTITAETAAMDITGFRLELLTDPRLTNNGPSRSGGVMVVSQFKVAIAPKDKPERSQPVVLVAADSDSANSEHVARCAIDPAANNYWEPTPPGAPHAGVFMTDRPVGFPGGSTLTFALEHKPHAQCSLGKFRLSTLGGPMPVPVPRPAVMLLLRERGLEIFDDKPEFLGIVNQQGSGPAAVIEKDDKYVGEVSLRIGPGQRGHSTWLGQIKIRENPGPGEARYLRLAWKKNGGQVVAIQLAHDGAQYGPVAGKPAKFRYQAGPGPEYGNAAIVVDTKLPEQWTVVTRDLFADFGEFVLNGMSFNVPDGAFALFDDVRLARSVAELDRPR